MVPRDRREREGERTHAAHQLSNNTKMFGRCRSRRRERRGGGGAKNGRQTKYITYSYGQKKK